MNAASWLSHSFHFPPGLRMELNQHKALALPPGLRMELNQHKALASLPLAVGLCCTLVSHRKSQNRAVSVILNFYLKAQSGGVMQLSFALS